VVKVLPTPRTQEETAQDKVDREDVSAANWWMVRLTGAIGFIGIVQAVVFWIQAGRLKETVDKMDEIAAGQTADMQASIAQGSRAAAAMQSVAESMAINVAALKETVATNKEIAARQKTLGELQLRSYISVIIGTAIYQDRANNLRFEAKPLLVNYGSTPARKVRHVTYAAILPVPLPKDFKFTYPEVESGGENLIGPHQNRTLSRIVEDYVDDTEVERIKRGMGHALHTWGFVTYEDAFGVPRRSNFGQILIWLPNDQVQGYFLPDMNDAT